jgi:hypothetical protein
MEMELVDGGEKLLGFCFEVCVFLFFFGVVAINISDGTKFLEDKDKRAIVLKVLRIHMCIISIHKIHICIFCIELLFYCMLFTQMVFTKEVLGKQKKKFKILFFLCVNLWY